MARSLVLDCGGRRMKQTPRLAACLYHPATILSKELFPGSCSSTHRRISGTHRPSSLICSIHLNSTIHSSHRLLALHVALVADSLEGCRRRSRAPGPLLAARPGATSPILNSSHALRSRAPHHAYRCSQYAVQLPILELTYPHSSRHHPLDPWVGCCHRPQRSLHCC